MLREAFKDQMVALAVCVDVFTQQPVLVLCAAEPDGESYKYTPVAKLFNGSPFDEVVPPDGMMVIQQRTAVH